MKTTLLLLAFGLAVTGCFQQTAKEREPLPVILWPEPPEVPRILFVNSISDPKDLRIKKSSLNIFAFLFYNGEEEKTITSPYGITVDAEGRYYVVDTVKKRIHVFDAVNSVYYSFPEEEISFTSPIGVAADRGGSVYVTDSKDAVIRIFGDHGKKYKGEIGKGDLKRPTGIAVNERTDELLVVDTMASNVFRYGLGDHILKGKIGQGGVEEGLFHYPTNIFVSKEGLIYVSDSLNFRIQIFSPDGEFLNSFGEVGDSP
jgi:sugar lactone lactonase YvrE